MPQSNVFLHSPFSVKNVGEHQNRALILQFILFELFHAKDAGEKENPLEFVLSSPACFFPYDWSYEMGCLNKIHEHALLLEYAFPQCLTDVYAFNSCLDQVLCVVTKHKKNRLEIAPEQLSVHLRNLYAHLQPFVMACKESETLLLFLLKNQETIHELAYPQDLTDLLTKMYPEGIEKWAAKMRLKYQNRGFASLLPEIDRLLAAYEK